MQASSAGNTRGLIEAYVHVDTSHRSGTSSAGNTRGLIEAVRFSHGLSRATASLPRGIPAASLKHGYPPPAAAGCASGCLPRGIPAASLKPPHPRSTHREDLRLPRGIPAASLKQFSKLDNLLNEVPSSAGNTRGLIEAESSPGERRRVATRLPRGIPAASLKPVRGRDLPILGSGLPRGIPAASLKLVDALDDGPVPLVFRGEYPRPH